MPRMANGGPSVDAWHANARGDGSSTFDLCLECAAEHEGQPLPDRLNPYGHNEPRGEDLYECNPNPDIDEWDYLCEICDVPLTSKNYYS